MKKVLITLVVIFGIFLPNLVQIHAQQFNLRTVSPKSYEIARIYPNSIDLKDLEIKKSLDKGALKELIKKSELNSLNSDSAFNIYKQVEKARRNVIELISTGKYFKKLMEEFGCDSITAFEHQRTRISNVEIANYEIVSLKLLQSSHGDTTANAVGYAIPYSNSILFAYDLLKEDGWPRLMEIAEHEFLHKATDGTGGLSNLSIGVLSLSFLLIDTVGLTSEEVLRINKTNRYLSLFEERYVRFKQLELDLNRLGIKNLGDELDFEAYIGMMNAFLKGELGVGATEFIVTTSCFNSGKGFDVFRTLFSLIA